MSRELDAQVAERIMDYRWESSWNGGCRVLMPADEIQMPAPDGLKLCTDWKRYVPTYSTDLNACAQAEAHLRSTHPELWRAYINALAAETGFYPGMPTLASMERFATASAEARCRAMLQVVGERA